MDDDYNKERQKNKVSRRAILNSMMVLGTGTAIGISSSGRVSAENEFTIEELAGSEATEKINQARESGKFEKLSRKSSEDFQLEVTSEKALETTGEQDRSHVVVFYLSQKPSAENEYNKFNIVINISNDKVMDGSLVLEKKQNGMLKSKIIRPSGAGFETTEVSSSENDIEPEQISCGTCITVARVVCAVGCNAGGTVICLLVPVQAATCFDLVDQICNEGPGCDVGARGICESLEYC